MSIGVPPVGVDAVTGGGFIPWQDSLAVPAYAAVASGIVLVLQLILRSSWLKALYAWRASTTNSDRSSEPYFDEDHREDNTAQCDPVTSLHGFTSLRTLRIVRVICCFALLTLAIYFTMSMEDDKTRFILLCAQCGTFVYALILGLCSLSDDLHSSKIASKHFATVLFVIWIIYVYRDVWPLATYTLKPADATEGRLLWVKFAILSVAAVFVPLVSPRTYIPVNPKSPMDSNPEQTASLLSRALFSYVDATIAKAQDRTHLPLEELPPIADRDQSEVLAKSSLRHLDATKLTKGTRLYWALLSMFGKEYATLAVLLVFKILSGFSSPVGINQLLTYLETDGKDTFVRPGVWVAWLFLGPTIGAITTQLYLSSMMRVGIRVRAILTTLLFEHALRMRVVAEDEVPIARSAVGSNVVAPPSDFSASDISNGSQVPVDHADGNANTSDTNGADCAKGKDKRSPKPPGAIPAPASVERTMKRNVIGRLNNLITVDVLVVSTAGDFLSLLLVVPLQTTLAIWLLHSILGWSAYVGLAAMIILYPVPGYITSVSAGVRREKMKKTDARVQTITETMQILRMIKLFGWESLAADNVSHKRTEELEYIKRYKFIYLISHLVNWIIPLLTMLTTFATYTVIMKQNLTASAVFSSIAIFDILRSQLYSIATLLNQMVQGKISLDRICEFLHTLELLDRFAAHKSDSTLTACGIAPNMIGIRKAAFTWSGRDEESTSAGLGFTLYIENELVLKQGQINVILGPTASGKTSLLMALLGEMHYTALSPDSFVNLPRARGIAYAAQESWIQSTTIRENILFNSPYDESRYREVIHGCALDRDLNLFEAGDSTEVGERGITLSGGQKARITLARALYSSAETLLLDDVFAALDVHTARWIAEKCFSGTLVQGRTVILVTHNVALAIRMAQFVIKMGPNGRIESFGPMDEAVTEDADPSQPAQDIGHTEPHVVHCDPDEPGAEGRTSKLIVDGRLLYLSAFGGTKPYLFWVVCFGAFFLGDLTITTQSWFLGYWARQYEERGRGEVNIPFYLGTYSALLILLVAFYGSGFLTYVYGSLRASHKIHENLISSILKTTFRWLDRTPTSRILARCTEDIDKVDGQLVFYLWYLIEETTMMSIRFGAILIFSPLFATPGAVLTWLGGWCGQLYMKAQLCVKREMSNANAPVLGHFATTISGLTSIRAYAAENAFRQELFRCIDRYVRASLSYYELARWVSVRLDALGGLFAASLAAYMVYGRQLGASNTGFSLAMAVEFSRMILWWIRIFNVFELNGNSLERIQQYLTIEHEPEPSKTGNPPAYWPSSGALRVEQLSARYSSDGPLVLRDISFEVKSGEHVGIVGRTGSGKSSLVLALLRCIVTEGHVSYDGIQTDTINLDILRSKVTVIPQVPELLSGSLRRNLDPFEQYDDAVLNDALRSAGLFSLQSEPGTGSLSLDSQTSSGGSNLSVGQRQIIALARALVRESKILILDEATSAIDYETDAVIQRSLRNGLGKDVTLLTIAHRLRTVMDADKLLILDAGRIVDYGKPSELLRKRQSTLLQLVTDSEDMEVLNSMTRSN